MKHQALIRCIAVLLTLTAAAMSVHGQTLRTLGDLPSNSRTSRVSFQAQHEPWSTVPVSADDLEIFDGNTRITDFTMQYIPDSLPTQIVFYFEHIQASSVSLIDLSACENVLRERKCQIAILTSVNGVPVVVQDYTFDVDALSRYVRTAGSYEQGKLRDVFLRHENSLLRFIARSSGRAAVMYISGLYEKTDSVGRSEIRREIETLGTKLCLVNHTAEPDPTEPLPPYHTVSSFATSYTADLHTGLIRLLHSYIGRTEVTWQSPAFSPRSGEVLLRHTPTGKVLRYGAHTPSSGLLISPTTRHVYNVPLGAQFSSTFTLLSRYSPVFIDSITSSNPAIRVTPPTVRVMIDTSTLVHVAGTLGARALESTLLSFYFADTVATAVISFSSDSFPTLDIVSPSSSSRHRAMPDTIHVASSIGQAVIVECFTDNPSTSVLLRHKSNNTYPTTVVVNQHDSMRVRARVASITTTSRLLTNRPSLSLHDRPVYVDTARGVIWHGHSGSDRILLTDVVTLARADTLHFALASEHCVGRGRSDSNIVVVDNGGRLRKVRSRDYHVLRVSDSVVSPLNSSIAVSDSGLYLATKTIRWSTDYLADVTVFDSSFRTVRTVVTQRSGVYVRDDGTIYWCANNRFVKGHLFDSDTTVLLALPSVRDSIVHFSPSPDGRYILVTWISPIEDAVRHYRYYFNVVDVASQTNVALSTSQITGSDSPEYRIRTHWGAGSLVMIEYQGDIAMYRGPSFERSHLLQSIIDSPDRFGFVTSDGNYFVYRRSSWDSVISAVFDLRIFEHTDVFTIAWPNNSPHSYLLSSQGALYFGGLSQVSSRPLSSAFRARTQSDVAFGFRLGRFYPVGDTIHVGEIELGASVDTTLVVACLEGQRQTLYSPSIQRATTRIPQVSLYNASRRALRDEECNTQRVVITPKDTGAFNFRLSNGDSQGSLLFVGRCIAPSKLLSPTVIDFGLRELDVHHDTTIGAWIRNRHGTTKTYTKARFHGASAGMFALRDVIFPIVLHPGDSITATIRYSPESDGSHVAHVSLLSDDNSESNVAVLLGDAGRSDFRINRISDQFIACGRTTYVPIDIVNVAASRAVVDSVRVLAPSWVSTAIEPFSNRVSINPLDTLKLGVRLNPRRMQEGLVSVLVHSRQHSSGVRSVSFMLRSGPRYVTLEPHSISIRLSSDVDVVDTVVNLVNSYYAPDTLRIRSEGPVVVALDSVIVPGPPSNKATLGVRISTQDLRRQAGAIIVTSTSCLGEKVIPVVMASSDVPDTLVVSIDSLATNIAESFQVRARLQLSSNSGTSLDQIDSLTLSFDSRIIQPMDTSLWSGVRYSDSSSSITIPWSSPVTFVSRRAAVCSTLITPSVPSLPPNVEFVGTAGLVVVEDLCAELDSVSRPPVEPVAQEVVREGNVVTIRIHTDKQYQPSLVDVLGRSVLVPVTNLSSTDMQHFTYNLDVLAPGLYFVLLISGDSVKSYPFLR